MGKKVRTHKFNGVKYHIDVDTNVGGLCDPPKKKTDKSIHIFEKIETKNGLRILLHEAIHASNWNLTEDVVDRMSTDIRDFLWRLNFRRKK